MLLKVNAYGLKKYLRTMACLLLTGIFVVKVSAQENTAFTVSKGAVVKGDQTKKQLALLFTGHEFGEGGAFITEILEENRINASFFFTGDFYRNPDFRPLIEKLLAQGNYLGAHSDKHLLYCDWEKRDSMLIDRRTFRKDLRNNYREMAKYGIKKEEAVYFLPPYEWYNETISRWTEEMGLQLINFSQGTRSNADYTDPSMPNYIPNDRIMNSILEYERENGLNGFMLLVHLGVGPKRVEKFYLKLPELIMRLKGKGYQFVKVDQLLIPKNNL
ncbi:hypothetical protein GCM10028791_09710 [Echinicola sediminis]